MRRSWRKPDRRNNERTEGFDGSPGRPSLRRGPFSWRQGRTGGRSLWCSQKPPISVWSVLELAEKKWGRTFRHWFPGCLVCPHQRLCAGISGRKDLPGKIEICLCAGAELLLLSQGPWAPVPSASLQAVMDSGTFKFSLLRVRISDSLRHLSGTVHLRVAVSPSGWRRTLLHKVPSV